MTSPSSVVMPHTCGKRTTSRIIAMICCLLSDGKRPLTAVTQNATRAVPREEYSEGTTDCARMIGSAESIRICRLIKRLKLYFALFLSTRGITSVSSSKLDLLLRHRFHRSIGTKAEGHNYAAKAVTMQSVETDSTRTATSSTIPAVHST